MKLLVIATYPREEDDGGWVKQSALQSWKNYGLYAHLRLNKFTYQQIKRCWVT